ncbi:MAG: hypothetical protein KDC98_25270 [Planctomycetes bacterium]|nr:hypothetical protein [Planctomycetota bacterium]
MLLRQVGITAVVDSGLEAMLARHRDGVLAIGAARDQQDQEGAQGGASDSTGER